MPLRVIDERLRRLQLRTRYPVEHLLAGEYRSAFKGCGLDFDEIRQYHDGDDVRAIDWNVTARTGRTHLRCYTEERELVVWLVADVSASCRIAAPGRTKWEVLQELAALLALAAVSNNDRVGLILHSELIEHLLPPRKGRQHVLRMLADLLAVQPRRPGTDPAPAFEAVLHLARRRALVVLLSDFQFDVDPRLFDAVAFRHDLVGMAVNHPAEIEPPSCGLVAVRDAEHASTHLVDLGPGGSEACRRAFEARRRRLRQEFARVRSDLLELHTAADCAGELARFFRRRRSRAVAETGG